MQLLRKIAFPISLLYAVVVYFRNYLYDIGWLRSHAFEVPIICVGNLSVGGTGKTPMVEFLIALLRDSYKIAVLSRGYKRKSKGFLIATKESTMSDLGDEPYQIYSKFPEVSLAVDANRCRGVLELQKREKPDIILLDDAFQHRKVRPDYSILLTSYGHLFVDDWYLPTGNLRDTKKAAKRADAIIVTKCPESLSEQEQEEIRRKLKPGNNQQVLFSTLAYDRPKQGNQSVSWELLRDRKITLITGIANPGPLVSYLLAQGLHLDHLSYPDHHYFSQRELKLFASKALVLTTEKDYVRLSGKLEKLYYLPVRHSLMGNGADILKASLLHLMKRIP
ncbi:MAG: tetraacyldisaccharide 4'-kinase [Bacteroidota bacterium]